MWTKLKEWGSACAAIITSIISIFKRIADMTPVQYLKALTNSGDPQSALGFVNVLWGCGFLCMFLGESFYQVTG